MSFKTRYFAIYVHPNTFKVTKQLFYKQILRKEEEKTQMQLKLTSSPEISLASKQHTTIHSSNRDPEAPLSAPNPSLLSPQPNQTTQKKKPNASSTNQTKIRASRSPLPINRPKLTKTTNPRTKKRIFLRPFTSKTGFSISNCLASLQSRERKAVFYKTVGGFFCNCIKSRFVEVERQREIEREELL